MKFSQSKATKAPLVLVLLISVCLIQSTESLATMAIDLGSEFIKVAIVKPGVPMEIALDSESSRKTATIVTMRNGERLFGNAALNMAVKFPAYAYEFIPNLLGKTSQHPDVINFQKNFPYYKVEDDEESGQLVFLHEDGQKFTSEELLAMLIEKARATAETHAGFPINAAVVTVPPFFTQASRRAVIRAAKLCNLNILQLMNDNTAVALNFGVFRYKSFNTTAQYYMFYDMGATSTVATVVDYRSVKHKEDGMAMDVPQLSVLGVGYDPNLGAVSFALRIRDHLAEKFNELKKTGGKDVRNNPRAMAKLYREAMRVLRVLSANQETTAQVENVMEEVDLKVGITRTEFQSMCEDLFARVARPVDQALMGAQLPITTMNEVILMGGGTRIPKVQEILMTTIDRNELGKSINSDEAAALGAVYQAAFLSPGFRVKRFLIKDATLFPLQVSFHRAENNKLVTRTLFSSMNAFPQKKILTFNRLVEDFPFFVHHDDLHHLPEELRDHVYRNLSTVNVLGVAAAHEKHMMPNADNNNEELKVESKGIKAHFEMDSSGLLRLNSIEMLFEKTRAAMEAQKENDKTTLEKLGSTISNFFGSNEEKPEDNAEKNQEAPGTGEPAVPANQTTSDAAANSTETDANNTTTGAAAGNDTKEALPKMETVEEHLKFRWTYHDRPIPSDAVIDRWANTIKDLRLVDENKRALEKSKNDLEAFIFDMRDKLSAGDYEQCSSEAERERIQESLREAGDWYDEQGMDTPKADFDSKLAALKRGMEDVDFRVMELRGRVDAFKKLFDLLNTSQLFYDSILNFTGEGNIFTKVETETLGKMIADTKAWKADKELAVQNMKLTERPVILVTDILAKGEPLHRELQYLLTKINIWKSNPPPPPPPPKTPKEEKPSQPNVGKDETSLPKEEVEPSVPKVEDDPATGQSSTSQKKDSGTSDEASTEKHVEL